MLSNYLVIARKNNNKERYTKDRQVFASKENNFGE